MKNFLLYPPWLHGTLPPLEDVLQGKEGLDPFLEHVDSEGVIPTPVEVWLFVDQLEGLKQSALKFLPQQSSEVEYQQDVSDISLSVSMSETLFSVAVLSLILQNSSLWRVLTEV